MYYLPRNRIGELFKALDESPNVPVSESFNHVPSDRPWPSTPLRFVIIGIIITVRLSLMSLLFLLLNPVLIFIPNIQLEADLTHN